MSWWLSLISDILISGLSLDGIEAAMDMGCGAGDSTRQLASQLPDTAEVTGLIFLMRCWRGHAR